MLPGVACGTTGTMVNSTQFRSPELSAHKGKGGRLINHNQGIIKHNSSSSGALPDYILCGSLNLHKSSENAAALAKHIANQWDFLRINNNGIISSKQLEINRNPEAYGGLRNGKPLTVSEWEELQKGKLLEKRKELAKVESGTLPGTAGAKGNSRGRRGRGSRASSSTRGSRGRGRGLGRDQTPLGNLIAPRGGSRGRSRGRGRGSSRGRGATTLPSDSINDAAIPATTPNSTVNSNSKGFLSKLSVKPPRLARRNLRDKGQRLPRNRGPDKLSTQGAQIPQESDTDPLSQDLAPAGLSDVNGSIGSSFHLMDEMVDDDLYSSQLDRGPPICQLDGNLSPSDSDLEGSGDEMLRNLYKPLIINNEDSTDEDASISESQGINDASISTSSQPQNLTSLMSSPDPVQSAASAESHQASGFGSKVSEMLKAIRNKVLPKTKTHFLKKLFLI